MDNTESKQLQVLANDLYIIHEKIIKTDSLIQIVKDKTKKYNKLEKLHKKVLDINTQLQLKHTISESKLNDCLQKHTPLETELDELKTRFKNAEVLHYEYVNNAELKYQTVCQELVNVKKLLFDNPPKIKEKRDLKASKNYKKEDLLNKVNDLTIELELTKSELENLNESLTEKDKIINKYEYEKKTLNEKIFSLNNLNAINVLKIKNRKSVSIQTENITHEDDFVMAVLPAITELDSSLPVLSDSICAEIVKSSEKEFTSSYMQTDGLCCCSKQTQAIIKSIGIQTDSTTNKAQVVNSCGTQTIVETNSVQLQTDDDLSIQQLYRLKLIDSSSQTYWDDIYNFEDILLEMTGNNPIISPLSPTPVVEEECIKANGNTTTTTSIAIGSDEVIPTFLHFNGQTDLTRSIMASCSTQTEMHKNESSIALIDSNCQTDQVQCIESNTQTETQRRVACSSQTEPHFNQIAHFKPYSSDLAAAAITKVPQTKLKNRLNAPNSKVSKKYKTAKNKLLEHLKHSNLDLKQILEKYLSEGNGPTLFVSPKILKSSQQTNIVNNHCKQNNPFTPNCSEALFKQCHNGASFNTHKCACYHSCSMQSNYPSCTTLQCNISCNGCRGSCNYSHRIQIKHKSKEVVVSSDSEDSDAYKIRNYYKNKFRNKYKAKQNCKCTKFSNGNLFLFNNKLNSLKREAKSSDTDAASDVCKVRRKKRKQYFYSSDSDSIVETETNHSSLEKGRPKLNAPVAEKRAVEKTTPNISENICDINFNKTNSNILNKSNVKTVKQKTSKIKRLRNLLQKPSINYNKTIKSKSSVSLNKNEINQNVVQNESNIKQSIYVKKKLDLFGSISTSDSNSEVDENTNKNNNEIDKNTEEKSKNVPLNNKIVTNIIKSPNKQNNLVLLKKTSQCAEKSAKPTNHVYRRPERRQTIPIGPSSPESVSCEFVKPKIIPLDQTAIVTSELSFDDVAPDRNESNLSNVNLETIQPSSFIYEIPNSNLNVLNPNLLQNKDVASKQNKSQLLDNRYIKKMIADVATNDWDKNLINTVVASLVIHDPLAIAKLLVNEAAIIDHSVQLDKSFTPPAPLMTPTQQKLLVLIKRLEDAGLTGVEKKFIILAEKRILSEKHLNNIQGLTRIYVALAKLQYDIEGLRIFCCNAAYYSGDLFLPIMFTVLTMWGDILPMASADVPLAVTLVQVIRTKTCSTPGYNTANLNNLLSDYYGYERGEKTNDQIMDQLVASFIENPCSTILTSILILCKNLPSKWRHTQIKKHFIPLVDKYRSDISKSKLISMALTLVNRIKDMFMNSGNDKEYTNELNVWLVKLIANDMPNNSNPL